MLHAWEAYNRAFFCEITMQSKQKVVLMSDFPALESRGEDMHVMRVIRIRQEFPFSWTSLGTKLVFFKVFEPWESLIGGWYQIRKIRKANEREILGAVELFVLKMLLVH